MDKEGGDRVARRWGDRGFTGALRAVHWMASPVIQAHLNRLATGRADCDWLTWAAYHHIAPLPGEKTCLVLGCGDGWLERALAAYPFIARIEASDFAPAIVEQAAARAREAGLDRIIAYRVLDLNADALPEEAYSVIVAHSVLHHIENLEHAMVQLARALKPGGLLLINEYVGPPRFQFGAEQMALVNAVMECLPNRYRWSGLTGALYKRKEVPSAEFMEATDPSEAVRSDELPGWIARYFQVVQEVPLGGTILHHLLYDIVQNFDPDDGHDASILRLACFLEERLVGAGRLPSDFLLMVARKGPPGRPSPAHTAPPPPRPPVRPLRSVPSFLRLILPAVQRPGLEVEARRRALHRLATGDPQCPWITWVLHRYLHREGLRVLILRDPTGWLAGHVRGHAMRPIVSTAGGRIPRSDGPFDLVLSNGALGLHPDPDRLLDAVLDLLAPGAVLVGEEQVERIPDDGVWRELAALLPAGQRPGRGPLGSIRLGVQGGRCPDLVLRVGSRMALEVTRPYGGAVVEPLLARMGPPPRKDDARACAVWGMIGLIEEVLTEHGLVPSPFVCFTARKPGPDAAMP